MSYVVCQKIKAYSLAEAQGARGGQKTFFCNIKFFFVLVSLRLCVSARDRVLVCVSCVVCRMSYVKR